MTCVWLCMQASQSGTEKQLARTAVNLQNSIAAVAALEKDLKAAGEKFFFLQAMRAYIADLCDMLQVCSPSLGPFVSHIKYDINSYQERNHPCLFAVVFILRAAGHLIPESRFQVQQWMHQSWDFA